MPFERFYCQGKNSKIKAAVQGHVDRLWKDVVIPAKIFRLATQNKDPKIIENIESVERTKKDYKKLLKKFGRNQDLFFELPTLKPRITNHENEKLMGNGSKKV